MPRPKSISSHGSPGRETSGGLSENLNTHGGEARPRVAKRVELVLELVEGAVGLFGALPDARPEVPLSARPPRQRSGWKDPMTYSLVIGSTLWASSTGGRAWIDSPNSLAAISRNPALGFFPGRSLHGQLAMRGQLLDCEGDTDDIHLAVQKYTQVAERHLQPGLQVGIQRV